MTRRATRAGAAVFASLVLAFAGVAIADSVSDAAARLCFVAAAVAAAVGARLTATRLDGPDRLAAIGACGALVAASCYGAAEVGAVAPDQRALALFVAPGAGLATVWWWGHAEFSDRLRWVPSMIGAGWNLLTGLLAAVLSFVAGTSDTTTWSDEASTRGGWDHALLYAVAAVASLAAFGLVVAGAKGAVSRARRAG